MTDLIYSWLSTGRGIQYGWHEEYQIIRTENDVVIYRHEGKDHVSVKVDDNFQLPKVIPWTEYADRCAAIQGKK